MKFDKLTNIILQTHLSFQQQAVKAINRTLTLRNWIIGYYIVEFEQHGEERAKYGENLLDNLGDSINVAGLGARSLKLFRQFYLVYPQIVQTVSAQSYLFDNQPITIDQKAYDQFGKEKPLNHLSFSHFAEFLISQHPIAKLNNLNYDNKSIAASNTADDTDNLFLQSVLSRISWTHHVLLQHKVKSLGERLWYMLHAIEHGSSRNYLP